MSTAEEKEVKGEKVCPKCGRRNKADRKYCKYCSWDMDLRIYPDD